MKQINPNLQYDMAQLGLSFAAGSQIMEDAGDHKLAFFYRDAATLIQHIISGANVKEAMNFTETGSRGYLDTAMETLIHNAVNEADDDLKGLTNG